MTVVHLPASLVREIAVEASVDPRSVARVLRGEVVRGMADTRIRRALRGRGIVVATPPRTALDAVAILDARLGPLVLAGRLRGAQ